MITIKVDEQDFGTICECALRYAMGRETYMPSLVRDFVRVHLKDIPDKALAVMLNDCEEQERYGNYGHQTIDKPGWVKWKAELLEEWGKRLRKKGDKE